MKDFFSATVGIPFEAFGVYHLMILGLTILAVALIYLFRKRLASWKYEQRFRHALGLLGIFWEVSLHIWQLANGIWTYADSAPVALCFISLVMGIVVMFTKSYAVFEVGYFWAIGGVASILFPDIPYGPDRFRFYEFLFGHMTFFVMFMYMVFVHGYYPTFRSFRKAVIYLAVMSFAIILPLDRLTNANFFFLVSSAGTPLEIFEGHGYLLYLAGVAGLLFIVMFLWYLPLKIFIRSARGSHDSLS